MKRPLGPIMWVALVVAPPCAEEAWAATLPPHGGTIVIEPKTTDGTNDPSLPSFIDAISAALTAKGFTIFDDPAHAAYLAELALNRATAGSGLGKNPNPGSVDVVGTSVAIPLSTGNSSVVTLQRTQLEIRIIHRDDDQIVWDGTAVTVREAGTRKGSIQAIATDLARALFDGYPAAPQGVIGVP